MWHYMEEVIELWEEAPKGDDTLDELMEHIERVFELVEDKHNWAALNNRGHFDKWYWKELKEPLERLHDHAYVGHAPKKRGTKPNRRLHQAVRILVQYWADELGNVPTVSWDKGAPISRLANFAYDLIEIDHPGLLGSLERALNAARTDWRDKRVSRK
jgi:hypothetical protein